ncbi:MAG TPA: cobalamin-binding protein [Firmicutes bacterium]|nr:cobalamin-binding protein [Candidatus Fermentithermobacillaceae bacterium]
MKQTTRSFGKAPCKRARLTAALSLALVLSLLFMAACAKKPKTYVDGVGRTISLEKTPERLVSLSPALTEAVFSLGEGSRLVGVSTFCNRPEEALAIEKVGDAFTLDTEKLVSLKPDLVLVAGSRDYETQVEKDLARLGIPAWVSGPATVAEVLEDIKALSQVLGVEKKGDELVEELSRELEAVRAAIPQESERPKVFIAIDSELWTCGKGSFIDDVIAIAGGINIAGDVEQQYLQLSMEDLLAKDPDVILVAIPEDQAQALSTRPGWSSLTAVKEGRVFFPNPDLISRPGPAVVEGIKEIASWLRGE